MMTSAPHFDTQVDGADSPSTMALTTVSLPTVQDRAVYIPFNDAILVKEISNQIESEDGSLTFRVLFGDDHEENVTLDSLVKLPNARSAYQAFVASINQVSETSDEEIILLSESSLHSASESPSEDEITVPSQTKPQIMGLRLRRGSKRSVEEDEDNETSSQSENDSEPRNVHKRRMLRSTSARITRSSKQKPALISLVDQSQSSSDSDIQLLRSDIVPASRKRRRGSRARKSTSGRDINGLVFDKQRRLPVRHSNRATRYTESMLEVGLENVYRSRSESDDGNIRRPVPKVVGIRESFKAPPLGNKFRLRHCQSCDTCGKHSGGPLGNLIYCQGCSLSYHKNCLGPRGSREHLVTKIADEDYVLQCRRCIGLVRKRELIAPDQGMCQSCREVGKACLPFREKKTSDNDGDDPAVEVGSALINNPDNVLFRCVTCFRAFHFHHLRSKHNGMDLEVDENIIADQRAREYAQNWQCIECETMPAKISTIIAWRPVDQELYIPGLPTQDVCEDDKEYLIKWDNHSYFRAQWMPGAWTWGVAAVTTRRAFAKKSNGNNLPTMNTEDAIPEEYLRIDIILDVKFTSIVDTRAEEVDKARIREVDKAYVKYKGLGYEDIVWETVPNPDDGERWSDFVTAYDDWVMGRYVHCPKATPLKSRIEKARSTEFSMLEKKKQPANIVGGELMKYQLDGINWLYYKWHQKENGILADEMGLGKTIQILAFLATLVQDHNCFPFLVVCPNSTCANWRREIKRWAPSLRVVTYFGSAASRSASYQYEMFPEGSKDLRCHVVVTSYDAAADDSCRKFFKSVPWQVLVVDEGQRLKSDHSLLYVALTNLKIPTRLLLTGTPLQNNARELFNLLQFLDEGFDAAALDLEYAELTKENVPQLHNLIRPFFLRRTKAQVLTFLPPMGQIIIPVSMSMLQNKLYNSILTKNPELVRAIFDSRRSAKGERANLNNLLMQLRKCLCHPFVYSKEIEERNVTTTVSHRNLVEASAKLQLLELLLPKLRQRGHRVLIFSQFLDMLDIMEDFLDGLEMPHRRLDGTISSLQKQKRIDEFNAPNSPLFVFLLSTRAGGVGINLASADTVIILDPDFNPHQDIQALSRAHRIGQKNKVLCFQLMTRASAEEKIVQIGRKKMALDHVLIERMDDNEEDTIDMESILRYGAAEILEGKIQDIRYDEASIDKLLDRSQIEDTKAGEDNSAESQFSFARVWANDTASMMDSLGSDEDEERAPDPGLWDKILGEREKLAAEEAAARQQTLGRGKRARQIVDYSTHEREAQAQDATIKARQAKDTDSDTDFQPGVEVNEESAGEKEDNKHVIDSNEVTELAGYPKPTAMISVAEQRADKPFRRAKIVWPTQITPSSLHPDRPADTVHCIACSTWHRQGYCPLKLAGPEYCNLCGLAHYGVGRSCPHIRSETQLREMLDALRQSPEQKHLIDLAKKYLTGVKGAIVQGKKIHAEQAARRQLLAEQQAAALSDNNQNSTLREDPPLQSLYPAQQNPALLRKGLIPPITHNNQSRYPPAPNDNRQQNFNVGVFRMNTHPSTAPGAQDPRRRP